MIGAIAVIQWLIAALGDPYASLAEYEEAASQGGLRVDRVCHARALAADDEVILDVPVPREITRCGECPILIGAVPVGGACQPYPGGSDCADGLVCVGEPDGRCVDPCAPSPPGGRCYPDETGCEPGWFCDPWLEVCRSAQGAFVNNGRRWVQIVSARMAWPSAVGWMPSAWFNFTSPATPSSTNGIRGTECAAARSGNI